MASKFAEFTDIGKKAFRNGCWQSIGLNEVSSISDFITPFALVYVIEIVRTFIYF